MEHPNQSQDNGTKYIMDLFINLKNIYWMINMLQVLY